MAPLNIREILDDVREDHELVAEQLRILRELEGTIAAAEGRHLERILELLHDAALLVGTLHVYVACRSICR